MFAVLTKRFSKPDARNGCEEYTRGETEEWLKTGKPCMNNEVGLSVNPSYVWESVEENDSLGRGSALSGLFGFSCLLFCFLPAFSCITGWRGFV